MKAFQALEKTIAELRALPISVERRILLDELSQFIQLKLKKKKKVQLNFICTHNSRRSQLAQVWAKVAAFYNHIEIECYSGGTETTALHYNAAEALRQSGFRLQNGGGSQNSKYKLRFSDSADAITLFSKKYDDEFNPSEGFFAIMTCNSADQNCPIVFGAEHRFSIPYDDPKQFDHTPNEKKGYEKVALQIASEMFYVFSTATKK